MSAKPYVQAPDSFWLQVRETPPGLEVRPFESLVGVTDELLCYYQGALVGLVQPRSKGEGLLVNLLPKLDAKREYSWPSAEKFERSLANLLKDARLWNLVCEQDCEQRSVPELRDLSAILEELASVYSYCKGGACQGSCRLIYAAKGCLRSAFMWSATTESRSGLRVTAPIGDQSRVVPDQRAGLRSRALRYSSCRAARMA